MTKVNVEERNDALARLREMLANVDEISTVLLFRSQSGMSRVIAPIIGGMWTVHNISALVAKAGIFPYSRNYPGLTVGGGGMDMGFHVVYTIGREVIGDQPWRCRGERCPSNEHVNPPQVDRGPGIIHIGDSGYRFRHYWL